ncbi:hypothetical protein TEK04_19620 [Klenkia sp. LSe6-5]|uniref:Uncharacterized protein n=1 Tax=Klenkia sesuvii TaxID=3103137 RepID=A0ABU8DYL4_9ACTN
MSATTAFFLALGAFLAAVADLVRNDGFLVTSLNGLRALWRRRRPPTAEELAAADAAKAKADADAQEVVIDGRIVDLKEHVSILRDLVDTANGAAAAATRAAEAAEESAAAARRSARAATNQLERWHQWAVRWWPVLRADAERLGVPDPPAMEHAEEAP